MENCNCNPSVEAYLQEIPSAWRSQIANVICKFIPDFTCSQVTDCETVTTLSAFTVTESQICITYINEAGTSQERCFDVTDLISFQDSDTIEWSGAGTSEDPFIANVVLSGNSGNAAVSDGDGLFVGADSGVHVDLNKVKLGGPLLENTVIDTGDYTYINRKTVGDKFGEEIWVGLPNPIAKITYIQDVSDDLLNLSEVREGLIISEISKLSDKINSNPAGANLGYYTYGITGATTQYAIMAYHTPNTVDPGNTPVLDDIDKTSRIIAEEGLIDVYTKLFQLNNNISIGNKVLITEASNKSVGTATLNNGTITIANTSITANSRILLSREAINGSTALGQLTYTKIASTSFTINSVQTSTPASLETGDDSIISYFIIN